MPATRTSRVLPSTDTARLLPRSGTPPAARRLARPRRLLADRGPALLGDRPGMVQRRGEVLEGDAGGALDVDGAGDRAGQRRGVAQLAGDVAQVVDRRPLPVGVVAPALLGPS